MLAMAKRDSGSARDGVPAGKPPQRCPYCLQEASVEEEPQRAIVVVRGCQCAPDGVLRINEGLARRRWQQLGVR